MTMLFRQVPSLFLAVVNTLSALGKHSKPQFDFQGGWKRLRVVRSPLHYVSNHIVGWFLTEVACAALDETVARPEMKSAQAAEIAQKNVAHFHASNRGTQHATWQPPPQLDYQVC